MIDATQIALRVASVCRADDWSDIAHLRAVEPRASYSFRSASLALSEAAMSEACRDALALDAPTVVYQPADPFAECVPVPLSAVRGLLGASDRPVPFAPTSSFDAKKEAQEELRAALVQAFRPGTIHYIEPKPVKARRAKSAQVAPVVGPDPRLLSNVAPHVEAPYYVGPALTPAKAKARRKALALACGCRLCALSLRPPLTFAEGEAFGYSQPDAWPPTEPRGSWGSFDDGKNPNPVRADHFEDPATYFHEDAREALRLSQATDTDKRGVFARKS